MIITYLHPDSSRPRAVRVAVLCVYGKSLLNTHAAAGGTVVIENRFMFPNTALDTLEQERCTGFSEVPSTFAILLNRSNPGRTQLEHHEVHHPGQWWNEPGNSISARSRPCCRWSDQPVEFCLVDPGHRDGVDAHRKTGSRAAWMPASTSASKSEPVGG